MKDSQFSTLFRLARRHQPKSPPRSQWEDLLRRFEAAEPGTPPGADGPRRAGKRLPGGSVFWGGAAAAFAAAAVLVLTWTLSPPGPPPVSLRVSGPIYSTLAETIETAPGTRLEAQAPAFGDHRARGGNLYRLQEGALAFEHHHTELGFLLETPLAWLSPLGTRFAVSVGPDQVTLAVDEGALRVEPRNGQAVFSALAGQVWRLSPQDPPEQLREEPEHLRAWQARPATTGAQDSTPGSQPLAPEYPLATPSQAEEVRLTVSPGLPERAEPAGPNEATAQAPPAGPNEAVWRQSWRRSDLSPPGAEDVQSRPEGLWVRSGARLVLIDPATGQNRGQTWALPEEAAQVLVAGPSTDPLFILRQSGRLSAFGAGGPLRWTQNTGPGTAPLRADDTLLYLPLADGRVLRLAFDGRLTGTLRLDSGAYAAVALAPGVLTVTSVTGTLSAWPLEPDAFGQSPLWRLGGLGRFGAEAPVRQGPLTLAVNRAGRLLVSDDRGTLRASLDLGAAPQNGPWAWAGAWLWEEADGLKLWDGQAAPQPGPKPDRRPGSPLWPRGPDELLGLDGDGALSLWRFEGRP